MKKLSLIFAMLLAVSFAMAQNNDAFVTQVGDNHDGIITQTGDNHDAGITQGGSYNQAFVTQTADEVPVDRYGIDLGQASVNQQGYDNLVRLQQRAFYGDAYAKIEQYGNWNKVYGMTDADNFLQNHGDNILNVLMQGNSNTLKSLASEAQKNDNLFNLRVIGSSNTTAMSQHYGYADVNIVGDGNDVTVKQYSGTPTADANKYLNYNYADIDIIGNTNDVFVQQSDTNNSAVVYVNGFDNNASITQTGNQVHP